MLEQPNQTRCTNVYPIVRLAERFAPLVDQEVLKDCERAFSVVLKELTECRQSLKADTLTARLLNKLKNDRLCYEFNVSEEMVPRTSITYSNSKMRSLDLSTASTTIAVALCQ